jgi:hypothetical protein
VNDQGTISRGISNQIEDCRAHAVHCAKQAMNAASLEIREDFLRLEQSWLQLARSYERARDLMVAKTTIRPPSHSNGGFKRSGSA